MLQTLEVLEKWSGLAERQDGHVEITCVDPTCFRRVTTANINASMDLLEEASRRVNLGNLPPATYEHLEQTNGYNFNPSGLLADRALRQSL